MAKYELTSETKVVFGRTLYRIRALGSFSTVTAGELGGFVEAEKNLDQSGDAWVSGNAQVYGNAWVSGDARVSGNAQKTPIHISGLTWPVTILDTHMHIGCEFHSLDDWRGFDDARIARMDGRKALKFWRAHRDFLLGIAAADGRGIKKEEAA